MVHLLERVRVEEGSTLYTDTHSSYGNLPESYIGAEVLDPANAIIEANIHAGPVSRLRTPWTTILA